MHIGYLTCALILQKILFKCEYEDKIISFYRIILVLLKYKRTASRVANFFIGIFFCLKISMIFLMCCVIKWYLFLI